MAKNKAENKAKDKAENKAKGEDKAENKAENKAKGLELTIGPGSKDELDKLTQELMDAVGPDTASRVTAKAAMLAKIHIEQVLSQLVHQPPVPEELFDIYMTSLACHMATYGADILGAVAGTAGLSTAEAAASHNKLQRCVNEAHANGYIAGSGKAEADSKVHINSKITVH